MKFKTFKDFLDYTFGTDTDPLDLDEESYDTLYGIWQDTLR